MMHSDFVESIIPFVDFVTHCPEVEIGLGAPRQFVRIVMSNGEPRFVQPATDRDLTDTMKSYVKDLVGKLRNIDGFVLKEGSPSCSISRVRYYAGPERTAQIKTEGSGFFGGAVLERFHGTPIESDGRLRNARIRETFLTKLFLLADLRQTASSGKMHELVKFHSRHKYSIMTFGQKYIKQLGRIVSNPEKRPFEEVIADYREGLNELMGKTPRSTSIINVMMKVYGFFSDKVSKRERNAFLGRVDSFRKGTTSQISLKESLRMWGVRFDESYIEDQSFFQPFPEELNSICDVAAFVKEQ
jgi:uncharacterized protein YbgA (DUF1722 family)/uncharacterized protein YbbK (DUF523 family)